MHIFIEMSNTMVNKFVLVVFLYMSVIAGCAAQILTPVKWTTDITVDKSTKTGAVTFSAVIDEGWHMYSMDLPDGGPVSLNINWEKTDGIELTGDPIADKEPHVEYDAIFSMKLGWWSDDVKITQNFKLVNNGDYDISGHVLYMVCNNQTCQSPTKEPFKFSNHSDKANVAVATSPSNGENGNVESKQNKIGATYSPDELWEPVEIGSDSLNEGGNASYSLWYIFFGGFAGGLLALLTPCVWPMIPLTVSFFLKKSGSRGKSMRDAFIYGVSIIVIYLMLGLLITIISSKANSLNELSTNAVFNIIFFLLLVVFAISFFGAFDIKLPDSWANKMDRNAENTSGLLSIFFMAFTLTLVSFSCTGPIIGTLLVEATSMGDITGPAVGMFGFALALAIPFTLFATFPSWLKSMPKSGSWLNSVKVVLGFIELALSLKFLSVADLAYGWGILDREVFLALWIVIFGLLGMYLLGKLRLSHDSGNGSIGVFRLFLGMISLAFTVYMIPGLWGAPLKGISAFAPPLYTQDFNLYGGSFSEYNDFDAGMKAGFDQKKPVLLDFSGYGCVNCRKMEAAVMDNNSIRQTLEEDFVMIKLMVDDKAELPEPMYVNENGKQLELSTYGDKWSYLQRYKFKANSQPYYVILDEDGSLLSGPYYYDEDVDKFSSFLNEGIKKYESNH